MDFKTCKTISVLKNVCQINNKFVVKTFFNHSDNQSDVSKTYALNHNFRKSLSHDLNIHISHFIKCWVFYYNTTAFADPFKY